MSNALLRAGKATPAVPTARGRRWLIGGAIAAGIVLLYVAYLGLSRTYPENSDEANILLMAHDMLHGNVFLRHWYTSDVPFITTELPEMALLVGIFGLHLGTAHIAVALTYTLVVVIGVLLARGSRREVTGRAAVGRMAVAGGIMLGPQVGPGVFILLLSVGHIGTAVPVMLAWLVVDRFGARVWVPVVVTVILAWALVADPLIKVVAIWPLMLVSVIRLLTWLARGEGERAQRFRDLPRKRWFEIALFAAAGIGWWLASLIGTAITNFGGYTQNPVPYSLAATSRWWLHARVSIDGLLYMFGANFVGQHGFDAVLAVLHLVGVVLAVWGLLATLRRFLSWPSDLIGQVLAIAIVANLVAYVPSTLAAYGPLNAREFAVVLPFAAVLAGRQLGARLAAGRLVEADDPEADDPEGRRVPAGPRLRFLVPLLAVVLAGYAWTVGSGALRTPAPPPYTKLIAWLESKHLSYGLGGYWQASVITVESGGKVTIRALTSTSYLRPNGRRTACDIFPYAWEIKASWYNPARNNANFVLSDLDTRKTLVDPLGAFNLPGAALHVLGGYKDRKDAYFGNLRQLPGPHGAQYALRIYHYNVLTRIPVILPSDACLKS